MRSLADKPLGGKAYGSIPHLRGSRLGPGDYTIHEGQQRICTERARDSRDTIIVQEKLDGSNVSVAKLDDGRLVALGRAGWLAYSSPYAQHHMFAWWAAQHWQRFDKLLKPGERVVGEWLAQAHGTRYKLKHEPFVAFDIMRGTERTPWATTELLFNTFDFVSPALLHAGTPFAIDAALFRLNADCHGALDPIEGCVWRVERDGKVDFLAKYVRPDKVDGCYLESSTGRGPMWNKGLWEYVAQYPVDQYQGRAKAAWAQIEAVRA